MLGDKRLGINIVLGGLMGLAIEVKGESYNSIMAPWGPVLNDEQIAAVLTLYVRSEWGNDASPVTPEDVAAERAKHGVRATMWTGEELLGLYK